MAQWVMNPISIHEYVSLIPGLDQWLWHRSAAAAPIQPLAWELPYATAVALKSKKNTYIYIFLNIFLITNNFNNIANVRFNKRCPFDIFISNL